MLALRFNILHPGSHVYSKPARQRLLERAIMMK